MRHLHWHATGEGKFPYAAATCIGSRGGSGGVHHASIHAAVHATVTAIPRRLGIDSIGIGIHVPSVQIGSFQYFDVGHCYIRMWYVEVCSARVRVRVSVTPRLLKGHGRRSGGLRTGTRRGTRCSTRRGLLGLQESLDLF